MDSSFKKKGSKLKESQTKQANQQFSKLNRHSFREIQHQFSKNRNNHQKALESLERINASSQEKLRKSGILATQQSMNTDSLSNVASSIRENSIEKDDSQIIHSRNKIYTQTNIESYRVNHDSYRTQARLNKTLQEALQSADMTEDIKKLKLKMQQQQNNFKSRLYDHEVYIKELLKEIDELSYAWSQSRQMLQQMRLQKQALERQMRKDRQEFNLLKEVLVKENNYYKNEIRIHQRETTQLRERLNKLAGLKSAYQMDHIEQKQQFTEQQDVLIEKVTELADKIKSYSVQIGEAKMFELKLGSLENQIKELKVEINKKQEFMQAQQNSIRLKNQETEAKSQQIAKNNQIIEQISKQIQLKQEEISFLKGQQQSQQISLKSQQQHQQTVLKLNIAIKQLKQQLEQSASREEFLSSSLSQKTMEANNLVTLVIEVNTTLNEKNSRIAELEEKLQDSHQKIQNLNESIMTFTKQIWSMKGTEAALVAKNQELAQQLNSVRSDSHTGLQQKIKKIQQEAQNVQDELKQKLLTKEEELRILRISIDSGKVNREVEVSQLPKGNSVQQFHQQTMTIASMVSVEVNTEVGGIDAETLTDPHENEELVVLRRQSQQNKQQIEKISQELGKAISLTDHLQSKQQSLLRQLETTNSTKEEHEQKINEMINKISDLEEQLGKESYSKTTFEKKYENIVDQFDKFRSDYDRLVQQKENLEEKIQALQKENEMSEIQMDELTQELEQLKERHQQLQSQQIRECEECKKMEKQMNRLRSELSVTKYGYEDRILRMEDENEELKNVVTRIRAYSKQNI